MLDQHLAENIRPCVVIGDPHPSICRCGERRAVALAIRNRGQEIDPGKALERLRHRQ